MEWNQIKINTEISPRGGSTIIECNGKLVIFGGADRTLKHFSDVIIATQRDNEVAWKCVETLGDIPNDRSGHAVVSFGKYMFLFGGIDFSEEVAYNDLYSFDTDTLQWHYIGESGVEISTRNSHSMHILPSRQPEGPSYLVIFGGACPESGILGDTYYAELPNDANTIDQTSFFVTWQKMEYATGDGHPNAREMHGSCVVPSGEDGRKDGGLLVIGGRSEEDNIGTILDDAWLLSVVDGCNGNSGSNNNNTCPLKWKCIESWELPSARCAHSLSFVPHSGEVCMYGGYTLNGIAGQMSSRKWTGDGAADSKWTHASLNKLEPRFGQAMCSIPQWLSAHSAINSSNNNNKGSKNSEIAKNIKNGGSNNFCSSSSSSSSVGLLDENMKEKLISSSSSSSSSSSQSANQGIVEVDLESFGFQGESRPIKELIDAPCEACENTNNEPKSTANTSKMPTTANVLVDSTTAPKSVFNFETTSTTTATTSPCSGVLIFGGVCAERDFNELWMVYH